MLNDANSGWVYHIGDAIFGDVLLVDAVNLKNAFSIYSSSVFSESSSANKHSSLLNNSITKYDCIIVNGADTDLTITSKIDNYHGRLKKDGVIAIVSNNSTSFKNINKVNFYWSLFKRLFTFHNEIGNYSTSKINRFYMQYEHGQITEVFYNDGYVPFKNPFLINQKIRKILLSKLTYPIFSSTILDVIKKDTMSEKTVIQNIVEKVGFTVGMNFTKINRCLIIPYKVLVSVSNNNNERYIFLLLRGSDKNIRANNELEMLAYLNDTYPVFSSFVSKPIANGTYKNVEYIIYREISGVTIDSIFRSFNLAELSAYDKLIELGEDSKNSIMINPAIYAELTNSWFSSLKKNFNNSVEFISLLSDLDKKISKKLIGQNVNLVHFHGDYKIENIIFDPKNYSVNGVIDWDLSMKRNFPGLDLLYFILYNRRIKNSTSFTEEYEELFFRKGFTEVEHRMLTEYQEMFDISNELINYIYILFMIHHFSCRERGEASEQWITQTINSMVKTYKW